MASGISECAVAPRRISVGLDDAARPVGSLKTHVHTYTYLCDPQWAGPQRARRTDSRIFVRQALWLLMTTAFGMTSMQDNPTFLGGSPSRRRRDRCTADQRMAGGSLHTSFRKHSAIARGSALTASSSAYVRGYASSHRSDGRADQRSEATRPPFRIGIDRLDLVRRWVPGACRLRAVQFPHSDSFPARAEVGRGPESGVGVYAHAPISSKTVDAPRYSGRISPPAALGDTPELRHRVLVDARRGREDDLVSPEYSTRSKRGCRPVGRVSRPTHHFYSPATNTSDGAPTPSAWHGFGKSDHC